MRAAPFDYSVYDDGLLAAAVLAVDPAAIGGVVLRASAGPRRDRWLADLRQFVAAGTPVLRLPLHVGDGRLFGGLDLPASLRLGKPVVERGILAHASGGILLLAMAERLSPALAARLCAVLDFGEVALERDGFAMRMPTRFGVVALDEGASEEEYPPAALLDRLAIHLDLAGFEPSSRTDRHDLSAHVSVARTLLPAVVASDSLTEAFCGAAMAFGIASLRPTLLGLRVAKIAAALAGRTEVAETDAALAGRLVLAPRATMVPTDAEADSQEAQPEQSAAQQGLDRPHTENAVDVPDAPLDDRIIAAIAAAIPAGLLGLLSSPDPAVSKAQTSGRAGALHKSRLRGRPAGVRRGEPQGGARLNVVETLRAAAPYQSLRRREAAVSGRHGATFVQVRREDFHVTRFKQRGETTTIFVVDASGSSALNRLAEAKGAVELLLADCYIRRDSVALIAFRNRSAELLLPPTRSLVRAKRGLAGLPGGGGTPLASAIEAAVALAESVRRKGNTPAIVLLTDGRANIARDGEPGRPRAEADALLAARQARAAQLRILFIDTSPRPQELAHRLAGAMGATYLALPFADAAGVSAVVRQIASRSP